MPVHPFTVPPSTSSIGTRYPVVDEGEDAHGTWMDAHGPTEHILCQVCRSLTQQHTLVQLINAAGKLGTTWLDWTTQSPTLPTHRDIPVSGTQASSPVHAQLQSSSSLSDRPSSAPSAQAGRNINHRWVLATRYPLCCPRILSAPPNHVALMSAGASDSLHLYVPVPRLDWQTGNTAQPIAN